MRDSVFLFSQTPAESVVKEALVDFNFYKITMEKISSGDLKNKNIIMLLKNNLPDFVNQSFYLNNNVIIFLSNKSDLENDKYFSSKVFCGHTSIKKFIDEIKICFASKKYVFKNIKILDEKITNTESGLSCLLTPLERDIIILLFEKKIIHRNYLLEEVLKLKKDIETKTIESHLTRIRKKLLKINSKIEILLKGENLFLHI